MQCHLLVVSHFFHFSIDYFQRKVNKLMNFQSTFNSIWILFDCIPCKLILNSHFWIEKLNFRRINKNWDQQCEPLLLSNHKTFVVSMWRTAHSQPIVAVSMWITQMEYLNVDSTRLCCDWLRMHVTPTFRYIQRVCSRVYVFSSICGLFTGSRTPKQCAHSWSV